MDLDLERSLLARAAETLRLIATEGFTKTNYLAVASLADEIDAALLAELRAQPPEVTALACRVKRLEETLASTEAQLRTHLAGRLNAEAKLLRLQVTP